MTPVYKESPTGEKKDESILVVNCVLAPEHIIAIKERAKLLGRSLRTQLSRDLEDLGKLRGLELRDVLNQDDK